MRFLLLLWLLPLQAFQIDRAILSTNDNPLYIEFWPVVAPIWTAMGIRPTLALIGDEKCTVDESLGDVIRFAPIPGVTPALQTQTIRLFLPALFPDDVCLISDIDMIPISRDYFQEGALQCPDNGFLVYRDKIEDYWANKYPMCYVAAKGDIFGSIFDINTIEDINDRIIEWSSYGYGWNTDELLLYEYVNNWEQDEGLVVRLGHGLMSRLDRGSWTFQLNNLDIFSYIDCHCPRPYTFYKKSIDYIANAILQYYNSEN